MLETSMPATVVASATAKDISIAASSELFTKCCSTEEDSVSKLFDSISSKNVVGFYLYKYIHGRNVFIIT